MGRRSIGGIDDEVKAAFDELQGRFGAQSASDALARLIEAYREADAERNVSEEHVRGMARVADGLARVRRDMFLVLADVESQAAHDVEGALERAEELGRVLAKRDEEVEGLKVRARALESELAEARAKAASVDVLAGRLEESERAGRERFERLLATFDAEVARHLAAEREADAEIARLRARVTELGG